MSWLDRFFQKADRPKLLFSYQKPGDPVAWDRTYDNFSKEGYQKNVMVFRCVDMIATACSGIPWVMYKVAGRRRKEEVEDHPLLTLLDKPNPMQYGPSFIGSVVAYRMIAGNSYILSVNAKPGKPPAELWPLMPNRIKVIPGAKSLPQAFRYGDSQTFIDYPVNPLTGVSDVLQMKNFHPTDSWYGMSAIEAAAFSVDQHNYSGKWNASLLHNSATPSGALVMSVSDKNPSGKMGDDQYRKIKEDLEHRFSGPKNAGKPMLLEGGLDWKQMGMSPKDMDWVNSKSTSARDICFAFGVPAQLIGIPGDTTYANYSEARLAFYEETILPLMDKTQAELNGYLTPSFGGGLQLGYDKDEIEALEPKRTAVWLKIQTATHLTVNEKRHATGYEELDPELGGDAIIVGSANTTLEALVADAIAEPEPVPDALDPNAELDQGEGDDEDHDEDDLQDQQDQDTGKAFKLFNVGSEAGKTREWKRQNRMRMKYTKRMKAQVSSLFKIQGAHVAAAVEGMGPQAAKLAAVHEITKSMTAWKPVIARNIKQTALAFGQDVMDQAKHLKGYVGKKDAQTRFESFLKHWMDNYVGDRIEDLEETTRARIVKAIQDWSEEQREEGTSEVPLHEMIQDTFDGMSEGRAKTIAHTEIGTASNYATLQAARSTGLNLNKEWVARNDGAESRPTHKDVNSTVIHMDEKFDVGDYEMVSPGDPSAGPEEICNCYCILIMSTVKGGDSE